MTRTVEDAALMLNHMAGFDRRYPASVEAPGEDYTQAIGRGAEGMRIGLVKGFSRKALDADVDKALDAALDVFAGLGVKIVEVEVPELTGALDYDSLFRHLMLWEFKELMGPLYRDTPDREAMFGPFVHADMRRVESVRKSDYDSTVVNRPEHVKSVRRIFRQVDALITPTLPDVPPLQSEGLETWLRGRTFNLPFSYLGFPAISVPCGLSREGLPIGIQLVAEDFGELRLLRLADAFEREREAAPRCDRQSTAR
jgi:aspartyl-tRNA(Asn)/glutamyl-tRNA(Gln) amidotransferase subunit A